ncbi:MAG: hypothetical protein H6567_04895 [Lewinellaceae bacterium]|nr:hypothetical protein [Lewinellaceae bacterium]
MLVFQTDGEQGFYYYNGNSWDLIGKGGNYWSQDTNGLFALSQNVGIGTSYPAVKLNIVGGYGVGLYNGSGYFLLGQESTSNLILDYRTIQARYNGSSALMKLNPFGGNVDIGSTTTSGVKLNIYGGSDASLSGGGYLQTGPSTSTNIVIDNNEIMARNNGTTSDLILQNDGGRTLIGGDLEIDGVVKGAVKFEQNEIDVLPSGSTQSITVGNKTFIQVNCNSSTCTSCSGSGCPHVILSNGEKVGQILILYGPGNPVDNNMLHMPCCDSQTTNYYLKSNFQLDKGNIITLIWLSPVPPEGYWIEVSRTEY